MVRSGTGLVFRTLLLAVSSSVLTLAAVEAAMRLFEGGAPYSWDRHPEGTPGVPGGGSDPRHTLRPNFKWSRAYPSNPRDYFESGNRITFKTNSAGFRDDDFTLEKGPGTLRIAFLGDSFAFGTGVRSEDTVPARLESLFGKRPGCRIEVDNFAVPGYETEDEATLLERVVMPYRPDAIVVWYCLNDIGGDGGGAMLGVDQRPILFPALRRHSAVARFVGARLDAHFDARRLMAAYARGYERSGRAWQGTAAALKRMGDLAHRDGIPILLFVHPLLYHIDGGYPFAAYHDQVIEEARADGFLAFDLLPAFQGRSDAELWVHDTDHHPNEIAHGLAAEYLALKLAPSLRACPPG